MSFSYENEIVQFVEEHLPGEIDRDTYKFVKELYEYVSFLYDGEVSEEELTSESSSEEIDDSVKESFTYSVDQTGFYFLN